jgi:hypothetical protein
VFDSRGDGDGTMKSTASQLISGMTKAGVANIGALVTAEKSTIPNTIEAR